MFTIQNPRKRASTATLRESAYPIKSPKNDKDETKAVKQESIIRQRPRRFYCKCEKVTARKKMKGNTGVYGNETVDSCLECAHESCQVCLYIESERRHSTSSHNSAVKLISLLPGHEETLTSNQANADAQQNGIGEDMEIDVNENEASQLKLVMEIQERFQKDKHSRGV
ncbi:hypothetical protein MMC17_009528 [Xylographa soralifera]|nr:hypothetical protein [Xylographa soralifera]